jgi:hypothetical protein
VDVSTVPKPVESCVEGERRADDEMRWGAMRAERQLDSGAACAGMRVGFGM